MLLQQIKLFEKDITKLITNTNHLTSYIIGTIRTLGD